MYSTTISSIIDRIKTNAHDGLIIVGPTCSGKTAFSIAIAKKIRGSVISADSRQVYTGLTIGTGKVTKKEMGSIPHYLIDVCDPKKTYTAHRFARDATRAIQHTLKAKRFPIVCGGTGFYIDVLTDRVQLSSVGSNKTIRAQLEKKTTTQLLTLLERADRKRYKDIVSKNEVNNRVRLIRAIEIARSKTSDNTKNPRPKTKALSNPLWIGIQLPKELLREKITKRLNARLRQGMIAEVKKIHGRGVSYKRMHALGLEYRFISDFLQGKKSKEVMIKELDTAIWHYARRQIAYWKRNTDILWLSP